VTISGKSILIFSNYKLFILIEETTYQVFARFHSFQQTTTDDEANLYMVIVGINGRTKHLSLPNNKKGEIDLTTINVGKVSQIFNNNHVFYIFYIK